MRAFIGPAAPVKGWRNLIPFIGYRQLDGTEHPQIRAAVADVLESFEGGTFLGGRQFQVTWLGVGIGGRVELLFAVDSGDGDEEDSA